ncbi:MAG: AGE family epimerase/isomerase [Anaerolineales bacterium]|nr:AGE family epimerase/isomerase [Anaerolineales bacterium]
MTKADSPSKILTPARVDELIAVYRDGLLDDVIPFWIKHAVDREYGGYMFCADRDGTIIDTDKAVWQQGRFAWMLATMYTTVSPNQEWLTLAKSGIDFLRKYGFDTDGRMFFHLTREGRPVRKRRYFFSETFMIAGLAAYARAAGDKQARDEAVALYKRITSYITTPGAMAPKFNQEVRPMKGLAFPMIMLVTAQILREVTDDPICNNWIDRCIDEIERDFMKPEFNAVLETVGPNGEFIDHFDGRMLNPGHAIEAAWFILAEAQHRHMDSRLLKIGKTILDWEWELGWDKEYGGIIYFRDVKGLPVQEYWQDMKFWWPQNEAIIATLLAYQLTGDEKYARWHQMIHDWTYARFPDPEYGEWFGYLHRDGRISVPLKGNLWKGAFHIPRMQWKAWLILEEIKAGRKANKG